MLAAQGIVAAEDVQKIRDGLDTILSEIEAGTFTFRRDLEDIHMNVEQRLADLIGASAGRLHTARSRNDQVATDFPPLCARHGGRAGRAARGPDAGHGREGAGPCRHRHAGLQPTSRPRSRSRSAITSWPMWRCSRGIAAACGMPARG